MKKESVPTETLQTSVESASTKQKIVVEKGIPIPDESRGGDHATRTYKYPFHLMEVGDSFFVPELNSYQFSGRIANGQHRTGFKFTVRTVEGGIRIWRTK